MSKEDLAFIVMLLLTLFGLAVGIAALVIAVLAL
jgi:hypothetical protein